MTASEWQRFPRDTEGVDRWFSERSIDHGCTQELLDWLSPIEFEEKYYTKQATAEPANLNTRQPSLTS
ncbi:hypothetical protein [Streptomyces sp. x-19]|uniref:hypothetical protein n=1 Tax=Streptomyces sp. x-19 TaxID=2789280 RepID=UPI00397FEFBE